MDSGCTAQAKVGRLFRPAAGAGAGAAEPCRDQNISRRWNGSVVATAITGQQGQKEEGRGDQNGMLIFGHHGIKGFKTKGGEKGSELNY